ncbi:MAG: hypothetical protein R2991_09660 [Thermoanaerobaculia bacterium]
MAFLPHVAITTAVFVGLAGLVLFPGLSGPEADGITFLVLGHLAHVQPLAYVPVLVVLLAGGCHHVDGGLLSARSRRSSPATSPPGSGAWTHAGRSG